MSAKHLLALALAAPLAACVSDFSSTPFDEPDRPVPFKAADFAAACDDWDDWDKPAPPFRIFGGTYHVGTCGISAILITSPDGHMLIDGGTEKGGELIAANIEKLGFSLRHIRYISHTQEHLDHVAGIAHLKEKSGARLVASAPARQVFETGEPHPDDPQFGLFEAIPTAAVDEIIADGEAITLAGQDIVARETPGHSVGALSWQWEECEQETCRTIVFIDGMGPFKNETYRFSDRPEYLEQYHASLDWLASAQADICLSGHPSHTDLIARITEGTIVDAEKCAQYAATTKAKLEDVVAAEASE